MPPHPRRTRAAPAPHPRRTRAAVPARHYSRRPCPHAVLTLGWWGWPGPGGDYIKVTGGTPHFFSPEMCGADMTGKNIYSGKAADMWALGVCVYMWLYHKPPCNAPTQMLLMEEIRKADIEYHDAIAEAPVDFKGHPPLLMDMLKALLHVQPQQRLRVRDLRRHPFLTKDGQEPLGEEGTVEAAASNSKKAASAELNEAVARVMKQGRMRRPSKENVQEREAGGADEAKESEQDGDEDKAVAQT